MAGAIKDGDGKVKEFVLVPPYKYDLLLENDIFTSEPSQKEQHQSPARNKQGQLDQSQSPDTLKLVLGAPGMHLNCTRVVALVQNSHPWCTSNATLVRSPQH